MDYAAEYLESVHLGFPPEPGEVDGVYTIVSVAVRDEPHTLKEEFAVEMMLRSGYELSRYLLGLNWSLEFDRRREFITSDSPVVVWRKPTHRDQFEGIGPENADEMRFPLDPGKQLVFSRRQRRATLDVEVHRVRRSNRDMAGACHRFIIGDPSHRAQVDAQRLHARRPVVRFAVGPLMAPGPDGRPRATGQEVVHMWVPRSADVGR